MQNLLTWSFWFNLRPEALLPLYTNLILIFLGLLLLTVILAAKKQGLKGLFKAFWKKLYGFSLGNLIIGIVLLFFIYERAYFLSARFWILAWVILMIAWTYPIIKSYRQIPLNREKLEKEKEFKKYLP